ncbi:LuxR C-terminal-related transcriptional regulator [Nocardioides acrostichi]|uniref:Response regulator transcription factor n=1 Tax=Nocardioides acrostichi TaxID=2784339 RepID=A0A930YCV0_9ACTN|nr:response regulator transcription factor [Nocardioides acrostichi]MBF4161814.1 response regulator transcription factor [Nocardioides acrostichi]
MTAPVAEGPCRVAAIDDHPMMLYGLETYADEHPDRYTFVGHAASVADYAGAGFEADVVLLDLQLGDGSRPRDNVRRLLALDAGVLVYTEGSRNAWVVDALQAGALGVVLKSEEREVLLDAISQVEAGLPVISHQMAEMVHAYERQRPRLARREEEALQLVAHGLTDRQAARAMGISEETLKEYLKRVRVKYADLGRPASSRVDLHRRAVEDGLIADAD